MKILFDFLKYIWVSHETRGENIDITKRLTLQNISNKMLERKTPSILESAITTAEREKRYFPGKLF